MCFRTTTISRPTSAALSDAELDPSSKISLIASDPPIHTKLRGLVTRAFTPRAVANLEGRIAELTHEIIHPLRQEGRMDLISDLAYPLPVMVIAEMLGVPAKDRADFKIWSDMLVKSADQIFAERGDDGEAMRREREGLPPTLVGGMGPYFKDIIAQRRAEPKDDLISALVAAELDGEKLSEWDLLDFCSLLLVAGNVTTTNLIGNAVQCFLDHPEALSAVREDRSLLQGAIEEVLRYRSPVQFMFRVSTQETELGGRKVAANQRVIALIGSANRDESKFTDANRFDIHRSPNPHIAFGHGVHYCLEARCWPGSKPGVVLDIMLDDLHDWQRIGCGSLPPGDSVILHGVKTLPFGFRSESGMWRRRFDA
ncbi:MAG: cytochrome P450 [Caldilineaceae bacterium]